MLTIRNSVSILVDMKAVHRVRRKTRNVYKNGGGTSKWLESKKPNSTINYQRPIIIYRPARVVAECEQEASGCDFPPPAEASDSRKYVCVRSLTTTFPPKRDSSYADFALFRNQSIGKKHFLLGAFSPINQWLAEMPVGTSYMVFIMTKCRPLIKMHEGSW